MKKNICGQIQEIDPTQSQSWEKRIFLTFDTEWASDPVLEHTLDILEEFGLSATIFVTHQTPLLERMRSNSQIELGIHPNFNFLLEGDFRYGKNYMEVLDYYKKIVPEATSMRSHSMVNSTRISHALKTFGIRFNCNCFIPHQSGAQVRPFVSWDNELTMIPFVWEDDISINYKDPVALATIARNVPYAVFNFHPIHVYLNSDSLSRYQKSKNVAHDIKKLQMHINKENIGIEDKLLDLVRDIGRRH